MENKPNLNKNLTIEQQLEMYDKLCKAIKKHRIKYIIKTKNFFKENPRPIHPPQEYEFKYYTFDKEVLRPIAKKIAELEKKKLVFERQFSASVRFSDLIEQIKKKSKAKVVVDIDKIVYPWGTLTGNTLDKITSSGRFVADYDILIYNKNYMTDPKVYFKKSTEINTLTKFSDGSNLSQNVLIENTKNSAIITVVKPENLMINFSAKELTQENEAWAPVSLIKDAVIDILDKNPIM